MTRRKPRCRAAATGHWTNWMQSYEDTAKVLLETRGMHSLYERFGFVRFEAMKRLATGSR